MAGGKLDAATSTPLSRSTAHAQYNQRAFGVVMLNNLIPITLPVRDPGSNETREVILVFGPKAHKFIPYKDYGVRRKCCRRVLTFNINHFIKCYLTSDEGPDAPFTYNCCQRCGVKLEDACGHLIQFNATRQYNVDKYIYRTSKVLQNDANNQPFKYQRGNC